MWHLVVWAATAINVVVLLMLWTCCLVTYFSPADHARLSLLTLAFPIFLLADAAFIIVWLVLKWKRVWLPIVGMLACWNFVTDYLALNLPSAPPEDALKVVSFNCRYLGGDEGKDGEGNNLVAQQILDLDADILCGQEGGSALVREGLLERAEEEGYYTASNGGIFVMSRLPIISCDKIDMPTRKNGGTVLKLQHGADTLMLINVHLESNHISPKVKSQYRDALHSSEADTLRKDLRPLVDVLLTAAPYRAMQTDSVAKLVELWLPRPLIVCGDFNDTPVSYTHRRLTSNLKSAFCDSGVGVGFTFHERVFPVRIDHILFNPYTFKSYATNVDRSMAISDHYPIVTYLLPISH